MSRALGSLWAAPLDPHASLPIRPGADGLSQTGSGRVGAPGPGEPCNNGPLSSEARAGRDSRTGGAFPGEGLESGRAPAGRKGGALSRGDSDYIPAPAMSPPRAPFRGVASQFPSPHKEEEEVSLMGKPVFPLTCSGSSRGNSLSLQPVQPGRPPESCQAQCLPGNHHTCLQAREGAQACHPPSWGGALALR